MFIIKLYKELRKNIPIVPYLGNKLKSFRGRLISIKIKMNIQRHSNLAKIF